MLTLIEHGGVYALKPLGRRSVLPEDDGNVVVEEHFTRTTNRSIHVEGTKGAEGNG